MNYIRLLGLALVMLASTNMQGANDYVILKNPNDISISFFYELSPREDSFDEGEILPGETYKLNLTNKRHAHVRYSCFTKNLETEHICKAKPPHKRWDIIQGTRLAAAAQSENKEIALKL